MHPPAAVTASSSTRLYFKIIQENKTFEEQHIMMMTLSLPLILSLSFLLAMSSPKGGGGGGGFVLGFAPPATPASSTTMSGRLARRTTPRPQSVPSTSSASPFRVTVPIQYDPASSSSWSSLSIMLQTQEQVSTSSSRFVDSTFPWLADADVGDLFLNAPASVSSDTSGIIGTLQSVAVGITAIVFFLAGATLLMANIIIPAAAQELEKECKELAPELWEEYLRKLEPGQTMGQRPDLMQELGVKLQPLLDAKIAQMAQEQGKTVEEIMGEDKLIRFVSNADAKAQQQRMNKKGASLVASVDADKDEDDDDDSWSSTPMVDLSAITDQIQVPSSSSSQPPEDDDDDDDDADSSSSNDEANAKTNAD